MSGLSYQLSVRMSGLIRRNRIALLLSMLIGMNVCSSYSKTDLAPVVWRESAEQGSWQEPFYFKGDAQSLTYRIGDIDHFNLGWSIAVNPFLGETQMDLDYTLWKADEEDPIGTDVVFSPDKKTVAQPNRSESSWFQHESFFSEIRIAGDFMNTVEQVQTVWLKMGVIGFDRMDESNPVIVTLNGEHAPFLEHALNHLKQPFGAVQILTVNVPQAFHQALSFGEFELHIDASQAEKEAVFGIDFVSLHINPIAGETEQVFRLKAVDAQSGEQLESVGFEYQGLPLLHRDRDIYQSSQHFQGLGLLVVHKDGYVRRRLILSSESHQSHIQQTISLTPQ